MVTEISLPIMFTDTCDELMTQVVTYSCSGAAGEPIWQNVASSLLSFLITGLKTTAVKHLYRN